MKRDRLASWLFVLGTFIAFSLLGLVAQSFSVTQADEATNLKTIERELHKQLDDQWRPLLIGGGGWIVGLDASDDGQILARTDTYGAYIYDRSSSSWSQLVTIDKIPRELFGFYPQIGARQVGHIYGGVFEITAAPSNSKIIYMFYGGDRANSYLLKSTDRGQTFKKLDFPVVSLNSNGRFRTNGRNLAVDPKNPDVIYAGTQTDGVWYSENGGLTWKRVLGIPTSLPTQNIGRFANCVGVAGATSLVCESVSDNAKGWGISDRTNPLAIVGSVRAVVGHKVELSQPLSADVATSDRIVSDAISNGSFPAYNIAFDASSGSGDRTRRIAVGGNFGGIYISRDGGQTWGLSPGGPLQVQHLVISRTKGVIWAVDGLTNGFLWKLENNVWTKISVLGNDLHSVAVDPKDSNHVVVASGNGSVLFSTFDGGLSWTSSKYSRSAVDVPWLGWTQESYMSNGDMLFDPQDSSPNGGLWFGEGIGVWYTNPLRAGRGVWQSRTAGIEQLIGLQVIAPAGAPIVSVWDRSQFRLSNPSKYPNRGNEISAVIPLVGGYGINYASSDHDYIVGIATGQGFGNFDYTSYSSDGGRNWLPLNSWYDRVSPSNIERYIGSLGWNLVQLKVKSTLGLTSWRSTQNGSVGDFITILPSRGFGKPGTYPIAVVDDTHLVLLDSSYSSTVVSGNDYYLIYRPAIPKSSYNGNLTITNLTANASGGIRATVLDSLGSFFNGQYVCLTGVTGTLEANGCWRVSVAKNGAGAEIDLLGSSYLHIWKGGGVVSSTVPAGGSIAVADPKNLIRVPSNNDFPQCTRDGGKSWSVLNDWSTMPGPGFSLESTQDAAAGTRTIAVSATAFEMSKVFVGDIVTDLTMPRAIPPNATVVGLTPTTVLLNVAVKERGVRNGDRILFRPKTSGWGWAYYLNRRIADADRVVPNLFYLFNYDYGLYQVKNCEKPVRVNDGKTFGTLGTYHAVLKAVPGEAGDLFFAAGPIGNPDDFHPADTRLWRSCDGGRSWSVVPNIWEPISVGYGAPAPGRHYPSIYVIGWYAEGPTKSKAVYGIWRSIDDYNDRIGGPSGERTLCSTGGTWQKIGEYPLGWSGAKDISGDLTRFGVVYLALGNGFAYREIK